MHERRTTKQNGTRPYSRQTTERGQLPIAVHDAFAAGVTSFLSLLCAIPVYWLVDILSTYYMVGRVLPVEAQLSDLVQDSAQIALFAIVVQWTTAILFSIWELSMADVDELRKLAEEYRGNEGNAELSDRLRRVHGSISTTKPIVWGADFVLDAAVLLPSFRSLHAATAVSLVAWVTTASQGQWWAWGGFLPALMRLVVGNIVLLLTLLVAFVVSVAILYFIRWRAGIFMQSLWAWPIALEYYFGALGRIAALPFVLLKNIIFALQAFTTELRGEYDSRPTYTSGGSAPRAAGGGFAFNKHAAIAIGVVLPVALVTVYVLYF